MDQNGLYEVFPSAYRQLHSTKTVLLRVQNDILQAVDNRAGAILVKLDLSAAFASIDLEKLLRTLVTYCGIKGDPLRVKQAPSIDQTENLHVQQNILIVCMCNSVTNPW